MKCIIHRWKYDLKTYRRCSQCRTYQEWFGYPQEWIPYNKKEYVIFLAEELKELKRKEEERDKNYKKAKKYLTSIGRMDKGVLV